ncbi:hypothetical protein DT603_03340 [Pseudoxanthomonas gei]|uniref:Uncharacterized protein n=2 Tax=Pseudoxanthomonas gei TaxID=1383030 RepID=A0ABX0AEF2_9GAMM|nr:hypothetical protein [Pseudoxanthomonas gei]
MPGATDFFTLVALIERPAIARVIIEPTTGTTPVADALRYSLRRPDAAASTVPGDSLYVHA